MVQWNFLFLFEVLFTFHLHQIRHYFFRLGVIVDYAIEMNIFDTYQVWQVHSLWQWIGLTGTVNEHCGCAEDK